MTEETDQTKPKLCIMSHKRLKKIEELIRGRYGEEGIDELMQEIKEGINFNDDYRKGQYTVEEGRRHHESRKKKAAELGVSLYQLRRMGKVDE